MQRFITQSSEIITKLKSSPSYINHVRERLYKAKSGLISGSVIGGGISLYQCGKNGISLETVVGTTTLCTISGGLTTAYYPKSIPFALIGGAIMYLGYKSSH